MGSARRLALLAVVLCAGCRPAPVEPWSVLIVSVDTLRADRLGCYGARGAATPAMDELAAGGVLFERAFTPVPLTLPAHATLLTGLQPPGHGLFDNGLSAVDLGAPTLAERLAGRGYDTGAFVAAYVLNRIFGLDRGFARYDDGPEEEDDPTALFHGTADARERTDAALAWLAQPRSRPFLLFVHYFDAHAPHVAPGPFRERFAADPYAGEVAYVDTQIRRLLDALRARSLERRTLVVLTADHGEGLGEHGEATHGYLLHDATLRVPLVLSLPGRLPAGRREPGPATLADVVPTVLDVLGMPADPRLHGVSLVAGPLPGRRLWAQTDYAARRLGWAPLRSLREGPWKLISGARPRLFDTGQDPRELLDVSGRQPEVARRLQGLLGRDEASLTRSGAVPRSHPEAEERLAALGYLGVGARAGAPGDPEDLLGSLPDADPALVALERGEAARAEALLRPLVASASGHGFLVLSLGRSLEMQGKLREAEAVYRRAAEGADARVQAQGRLVALARHRGDSASEVAEAEQLARDNPRHAASQRLLAEALARAGRPGDAERAFASALALAPASLATQAAWGRWLLAQGRTEEAAGVVAALRSRAPASVHAAALGGLLELSRGEARAGRTQIDQALAERPGDPQLLAERARAALALRDWGAASADLERALALWPGCPEARADLARLRREAPAPWGTSSRGGPKGGP